MKCPNTSNFNWKEMEAVKGANYALKTYAANNESIPKIGVNKKGNSALYSMLESIAGKRNAMILYGPEFRLLANKMKLSAITDESGDFVPLVSMGRKGVTTSLRPLKSSEGLLVSTNSVSFIMDNKSVVKIDVNDQAAIDKAVNSGRTVLAGDTYITKAAVTAIPVSKAKIASYNKTVRGYKTTKQNTTVHNFLENMLRNYTKSLPGFDFKMVHSEDLPSKYKTEVAWLDPASSTVYYNMDNITTDSYIHELTHIILPVLQSTHEDLYNDLMELVDQEIENNTGEIASMIKMKHPEFSKEQLRNEVAAKIAGFVSEEVITKYAAQNGVKMLPNQEHISMAKRIIDWFLELLGFNGKPKYNSTLTGIFQTVASKVANGENYFSDYDPSLMQSIVANYYHGSVVFNEQQVRPIQNIKDLVPFLLNNINGDLDIKDMSKDNKRLISKLTGDIHKDANGNYVLYYGSIPYKSTISKEDLIQQIPNILAKAEQKYESNIGMFLKYMDMLVDGKSQDEAFNGAFGDSNINTQHIEHLTKLSQYFGNEQEIEKIIRYSDLAYETNPDLQKLYRKELVGFDPYIAIHKGADTNISIIDITTDKLNRNNAKTSGHLISSSFMSDVEAKGHNITMLNKMGDIRNFMLGITIAGMQKQVGKGKIKISNIGSIYFTGSGMPNALMISDMEELLHNVTTVMNNKKVSEHVNSTFLTDVFSSSDLFDASNYAMPWISRLRSYYQKYINDPNNKNTLERLNGDSMTDEKLMEVIKMRLRELDTKKLKRDNQEYHFLSNSLYELKTRRHINTSKVNDVHKYLKYAIPMHAVGHDIVQWIQQALDTSIGKIIHQYKNFKKEMSDQMDKSGISLGGQNLVMEQAGKHYDKYFQHTEVIADKDYPKLKVKEGQTINIVLPILLTSDTKKAQEMLAAGEITQEELTFIDWVAEKAMQRFIDNQYHQTLMNTKNYDRNGNPTVTRKDTEDYVRSMVKFGTVPYVAQSAMEQLQKGRFDIFVSKKWKQLQNDDVLLEDMINSEKAEDLTSLTSIFAGQISENVRFDKMGLYDFGTQTEDETIRPVVYDLTRAMSLTTNIESIMNTFMMDGIRTEEYQKSFMPVYNAGMGVISYFEGMNKNQDQVRDMLEQNMKRVVMRKNNDPENDSLAPIVRGTLSSLSFITLGYRPDIWFKSAVYNNVNQLLHSSAVKLANYGTENKMWLPEPEHYTKANKLFVTDFKKIVAMAREAQILEESEMEIMNSVRLNRTNRKLWENQLSQIGNWATDVSSRMITMTAMMLKDGSYDAHIYNEETGDVTWDEKKDTRFYDESGKAKTENGEHVLLSSLKERMNSQSYTNNKGEYVIGYDMEEIATTTKWISNKFIIGTMTEQQRVLMGNSYAGKLLTMFRIFSFDKIINAGVYGKQRMSDYGGRYKAVKDENGEWITKKEQMMIEGAWQSIMAMRSELSNIKDLGFKEAWNEMPQIRRYNYMATAIRVAFVAIMYALVKAVIPDDDKDQGGLSYKQRKLSWLATDFAISSQAGDWIRNPVPSFTIALDLINVAVGKEDIKKLENYSMPYKGSKRFIDWVDAFSEDEN